MLSTKHQAPETEQTDSHRWIDRSCSAIRRRRGVASWPRAAAKRTPRYPESFSLHVSTPNPLSKPVIINILPYVTRNPSATSCRRARAVYFFCVCHHSTCHSFVSFVDRGRSFRFANVCVRTAKGGADMSSLPPSANSDAMDFPSDQAHEGSASVYVARFSFIVDVLDRSNIIARCRLLVGVG